MVEMLVGLNVIHDERYAEYRRRMTPLLESRGGSFGYDFRVSEVLITATPELINRVFTIRFQSEEEIELFFSNPEYLAIKEEFFEGAVLNTTVISTYVSQTDPA